MKRDSWSSKFGFVMAAAGSAVGLANIWRFPYLVGNYGGAAFIIVYFLALAFIGFPVFLSEILLGRTAQSTPSGAFRKIGGNAAWSAAGKMTIITGFLVSAFYSAVAAWILGYLIEAAYGNLTQFTSPEQAELHYQTLIGNPLWGVGFHFLFLLLCLSVLMTGVRKGIEFSNKLLMPLLFLVLILLVVKGLSMENASQGLIFLFSPDWKALTPMAFLVALGQAFFTLSIGQGTMITYGSYLGKKENVITSCLPVVLMDTLVAFLSAIAVFTIVFSGGLKPDAGPALIFHTLPWVFSKIPGGYFVAILFFLLVFMAALTSEISALEPSIAYLIDEWKWKRKYAVMVCGLGAFLIGIPCALSSSLLKEHLVFGFTFLDFMDFATTGILIPLGGLFAVLLVGWFWGIKKAVAQLKEGGEETFQSHRWLPRYLSFSLKYSAPVLILFVLFHALFL